MKFVVCESYEELSQKAADVFALQIQKKPDSVLGLATGSTPLGFYAHLCKRYQEGALDFSKVNTFNLDEYYPISHTHAQSYHVYMEKNLFSHVNLQKENIHLPSGEAKDPNQAAHDYSLALQKVGGLDLQLLGVGHNGHIGFNEPNTSLELSAHVEILAERTRKANARFFACEKDVPSRALTMGLGEIFNAKKLVLLCYGKEKANCIQALKKGKITTQVPVTLLALHPDITVFCDTAAMQAKNADF